MNGQNTHGLSSAYILPIGSKEVFDFCCKIKQNFEFFSFFVFIIELKNEFQIPISIFNKNWKMDFYLVFLRNFFCAQVLIWSITSSKLPLKTNLFIYFQFFKNKKRKFWFLFKSNFEIQMQFLNFVFLFDCQVVF